MKRRTIIAGDMLGLLVIALIMAMYIKKFYYDETSQSGQATISSRN